MSEERASETATVGGGCFWCLDAAFRDLRGIDRVVSGYAGGRVRDPSYEAVCTGTTGHAEVVQVTYDPRVITYDELLEVFFALHDPTTPNRQGADVGPQYRSIIFYHDDAQRAAAEATIRRLTEEQVWDAPIVTQLEPIPEFWPAEEYHQDYFAKHPGSGYCQVVVAPKVAKLRRAFASKLRTPA